MPSKRNRSPKSPKPAAKPEPQAPKRGRGRPPGTGFQVTEEQRRLVKMMAAWRIPQDEIALMINNPRTGNPISETTLKNLFPNELKVGYLEGRNRIMAASFKSAVEGNVTAQIWLQKTLYGFHERMRVELPPPEGLGIGSPDAPDPDDLDPLERARRVAFTLAMGAHQAVKKRREEA